MSVTHAFVSTKPEGSDPAQVKVSNWNDDHVVVLTQTLGGLVAALPSDTGHPTGHPQGAPLPPDPGLALDLAELYTSAWLDEEIARHFWLQDEEDAAVLLLAIAVLH